MHPSQPNLTPHMDVTQAWINVYACMAQWLERLLFDPEGTDLITLTQYLTVIPPHCDS